LLAARSASERGELCFEALPLGAGPRIPPLDVIEARPRDGAALVERAVPLEILFERALGRPRGANARLERRDVFTARAGIHEVRLRPGCLGLERARLARRANEPRIEPANQRPRLDPVPFIDREVLDASAHLEREHRLFE